jgi:hypothetical protein
MSYALTGCDAWILDDAARQQRRRQSRMRHVDSAVDRFRRHLEQLPISIEEPQAVPAPAPARGIAPAMRRQRRARAGLSRAIAVAAAALLSPTERLSRLHIEQAERVALLALIDAITTLHVRADSYESLPPSRASSHPAMR